MQLGALVLAATAAAGLVVPEIAEGDENIFRALPIPSVAAAQAESHLVSVPCSQCEQGRGASLQLNLTVADNKRLLVNDFEVYPEAKPWHGDLEAALDGGSNKHRLGYSLAVVPGAEERDGHLQLVDVELGVFEVGDQFVEGLPVVRAKLITAPLGEIVGMAAVDLIDDKASGCDTMACRARKAVMDTLHSLKKVFKPLRGCHGRLRGKPNHAHSPQHQHVSTEQPHHHHRVSLRHKFARLIWSIFSPFCLGLSVGIIAATLHRLYVCLTTRNRDARRQDPEEAVASEKEGLMENLEAPVEYDADAKVSESQSFLR